MTWLASRKTPLEAEVFACGRTAKSSSMKVVFISQTSRACIFVRKPWSGNSKRHGPAKSACLKPHRTLLLRQHFLTFRSVSLNTSVPKMFASSHFRSVNTPFALYAAPSESNIKELGPQGGSYMPTECGPYSPKICKRFGQNAGFSILQLEKMYWWHRWRQPMRSKGNVCC
jgi:hypothetical protein